MHDTGVNEIAHFLGMFATITFCHVCVFLCPYVCMEQLGSHWTYFFLNFTFEYFLKICWKIQVD